MKIAVLTTACIIWDVLSKIKIFSAWPWEKCFLYCIRFAKIFLTRQWNGSLSKPLIILSSVYPVTLLILIFATWLMLDHYLEILQETENEIISKRNSKLESEKILNFWRRRKRNMRKHAPLTNISIKKRVDIIWNMTHNIYVHQVHKYCEQLSWPLLSDIPVKQMENRNVFNRIGLNHQLCCCYTVHVIVTWVNYDTWLKTFVGLLPWMRSPSDFCYSPKFTLFSLRHRSALIVTKVVTLYQAMLVSF